MLDAIQKTLGEVVQDDAATGLFRCKRNLMDQFSSQIRTYRPLAKDRTHVR